MSFEVFKNKINLFIERAGGNIDARFSSEDGCHYAKCSDGTTIIGNEDCLKVTVRWNGKNHQAMVAI